MMLKPEQLRNMRDCANDGMPFNAHTILMLLDHIDAQQARIAELEAKWLDEREAYLQERNKCEQLEKDALRYRKLRSWHWSESDFCVVANPKENVKAGAICPSKEVLDGLLDLYLEEDKN